VDVFQRVYQPGHVSDILQERRADLVAARVQHLKGGAAGPDMHLFVFQVQVVFRVAAREQDPGWRALDCVLDQRAGDAHPTSVHRCSGLLEEIQGVRVFDLDAGFFQDCQRSLMDLPDLVLC